MLIKYYSFVKESIENNILNNPNFIKWFGNSKVVDENGKPLIVYHGSPQMFNEFSHDKIGIHGTSEGGGFYFTNAIDVAKAYVESGKLYEVYLKIEKPLSYTNKKITRIQLGKFLSKCDPEGDDVLSGVGDVNYEGYNKVLRDAVDLFYKYNDNDVDMIHSILHAGGTDYNKIFTCLYKTLGYDGIIVEKPSWGKQKLYIAFFSNFIKSVDNKGSFSLSTGNIFEKLI